MSLIHSGLKDLRIRMLDVPTGSLIDDLADFHMADSDEEQRTAYSIIVGVVCRRLGFGREVFDMSRSEMVDEFRREESGLSS